MASEGPNSPGTAADDATVGTWPWNNPDNAKSSDDNYAIAAYSSSDKTTHYLKVTNFGFTIPAGATINGIKVEVERRCDFGGGGFVVDNEVKIVQSDGSIGAENKADAITHWAFAADEIVAYGGIADLWSEAWASGDINDIDFGTVVSAFIDADGVQQTRAKIDHIKITVYYTEEAEDINPKVKIAGTFSTKTTSVKIAGNFVEKPVLVKVGGVFQ